MKSLTNSISLLLGSLKDVHTRVGALYLLLKPYLLNVCVVTDALTTGFDEMGLLFVKQLKCL